MTSARPCAADQLHRRGLQRRPLPRGSAREHPRADVQAHRGAGRRRRIDRRHAGGGRAPRRSCQGVAPGKRGAGRRAEPRAARSPRRVHRLPRRRRPLGADEARAAVRIVRATTRTRPVGDHGAELLDRGPARRRSALQPRIVSRSRCPDTAPWRCSPGARCSIASAVSTSRGGTCTTPSGSHGSGARPGHRLAARRAGATTPACDQPQPPRRRGEPRRIPAHGPGVADQATRPVAPRLTRHGSAWSTWMPPGITVLVGRARAAYGRATPPARWVGPPPLIRAGLAPTARTTASAPHPTAASTSPCPRIGRRDRRSRMPRPRTTGDGVVGGLSSVVGGDPSRDPGRTQGARPLEEIDGRLCFAAPPVTMPRAAGWRTLGSIVSVDRAGEAWIVHAGGRAARPHPRGARCTAPRVPRAHASVRPLLPLHTRTGHLHVSPRVPDLSHRRARGAG